MAKLSKKNSEMISVIEQKMFDEITDKGIQIIKDLKPDMVVDLPAKGDWYQRLLVLYKRLREPNLLLDENLIFQYQSPVGKSLAQKAIIRLIGSKFNPENLISQETLEALSNSQDNLTPNSAERSKYGQSNI